MNSNGPRWRLLAGAVVAALLSGFVSVATAPSASAATLEVWVRILKVEEIKCDEGDFTPCPDDWYSRVSIGGQPFEQSARVDNPNPPVIEPNWTFIRSVDSELRDIPIVIQIWDHDNSSADDLLGASPVGNDINLNLNLANVKWAGDLPENSEVSQGEHVRVTFAIRVVGRTDLDEDGIPDDIERFGIRDGRGNLLADMAALGADPCRKSVPLEIDFMDGAANGHTHRPLEAAIAEIVTVFDEAPVPATEPCPYEGFPRKPTGIDLLVDIDDAIPEAATFTWDAAGNAARTQHLTEHRRPWFHWVLFAHALAAGDSTSGLCCSNSGKDLLVTLGGWTNQVGSVREQSGTLMHELGHALGLGHGGADEVNCKPNYLSTMNYPFQQGVVDPALPAPNVDTNDDGIADTRLRLDYSRAALPTLNEASLNELDGIGDGTDQTLYTAPDGLVRAAAGNAGIDWNRDNGGVADDTDVAVDINQMPIPRCGREDDGITPAPSPDEELVGHDDWSNLKYRGAFSPAAGLMPEQVREIDFESMTKVMESIRAAHGPDLSISQKVKPERVHSGDKVTYSIKVHNAGPGDAPDVVITQELPPGMTARRCDASRGGVCGGTPEQPTVSFATIPEGKTVKAEIHATTPCATPDRSRLTATASVTNSRGDPEPTNDSATAVVTVKNPPPTISRPKASPSSLSPANGKLRKVDLDYRVKDNCGKPTVVVDVTSSDPVLSERDRTSPDWIVSSPKQVKLRAEHAGEGKGRTYTVAITATDSAGGSSTATVDVRVARHHRR